MGRATQPIPSAHGFQQFSHFDIFDFGLKQWFLAGQFQCPHCGFPIFGTLSSGASPYMLDLDQTFGGGFVRARSLPSGNVVGLDETSTNSQFFSLFSFSFLLFSFLPSALRLGAVVGSPLN